MEGELILGWPAEKGWELPEGTGILGGKMIYISREDVTYVCNEAERTCEATEPVASLGSLGLIGGTVLFQVGLGMTSAALEPEAWDHYVYTRTIAGEEARCLLARKRDDLESWIEKSYTADVIPVAWSSGAGGQTDALEAVEVDRQPPEERFQPAFEVRGG